MLKSALAVSQTKESYVMASLQVLAGSIFLALMSQLSCNLPFTPVPMSLQTLAIFILGMTLGSKKAPLAVMAYLIEGTMGLPVFAGGAIKPLWFILPTAGYLVGFVFSSYLMGKIYESNRSSMINTLLACLVSEIVLMGLGMLWLSTMVGLQQAFWMGVFPFLMGSLIKMTIATWLTKPLLWLKSFC